MKKILAVMFGLSVVSGVYAQEYTMYEKPDIKSKELAKIDDQSPQYQAIFSKDDWIEIVDKKDGKVGWVKQKSAQEQAKSSNDPIEEVMQHFQERQRMMDEHFNKMLAHINQGFGQVDTSSGSSVSNQPKTYKKFSSVTINSDGKTAKIVKKTEDGNGNIQTVEKEVPADQLDNIKIED